MTSQSTTTNILKKYISRGVTLILCIAIIAVSLFSAYLWLPASIHYHVVEKHSIPILHEPTSIKFGIILPQTGPYQTIENVNVEWNGDLEKTPYTYVDAYRLWGGAKEGQEFEVRIEYDVILPQGKVSWDAPVAKAQTLPQNGIESGHPLIIDTASQLSNDPYQIYRFTAEHLIYPEENCQESNISALEALRSGVCACLGYARLMVALCRATGIPAQMTIGTILPDEYFSLPQISSSVFPDHGHAWVEYHSQGGWSLADPSLGKGYAARLEFNRNDGRHLSYGNYDHLMQVRNELYRWVSDQRYMVDAQLTYLISSDVDSTTPQSEIILTKTWDGRWLNTVIVLVLITFVLRKFRDKFFMKEITGGE
jgi:transglutaminase-like putative cysteine protease